MAPISANKSYFHLRVEVPHTDTDIDAINLYRIGGRYIRTSPSFEITGETIATVETRAKRVANMTTKAARV